MFQTLKSWARAIKGDIFVLYFAARDPRTPLAAKIVTALVVAYALSPIDLIPDFIPVLGWLDDLIILPLGIALALKLLPPEVLAGARARAAAVLERPRRYRAKLTTAVIFLLWLGLAALAAFLIHRNWPA